MSTASNSTRRELVNQLRRRLHCLQPANSPHGQPLVPSGCAALDNLLPAGGFRRGSLVEWLGQQQGGGAGTLAIAVARQACADGAALVVMDRQRQFYPPALAAWGVDLRQVVVVQPNSRRDEQWALVQVLGCPAVAAVWGKLDRIDERLFRRLQLAAESSGCLGLLVRPAHVLGQPSWSETQLLVEPEKGGSAASSPAPLCSWRFRVRLLRCRGGTNAGLAELEIDDTTGMLRGARDRHETHSVHLASQLARPAVSRRAARA